MPSRTARAPPPAPGSSLSTDALIVGTSGIESRYAWIRLAASVLRGTIAGVGIWSIVVAMPAVQAEFAVDRGPASLPYTSELIGLLTGPGVDRNVVGTGRSVAVHEYLGCSPYI